MAAFNVHAQLLQTTSKWKLKKSNAPFSLTKVQFGLWPLSFRLMYALYNKVNELRAQRYEQIIAANPSQAVFKNSWLSRIKPNQSNEMNTSV